MTETLAIALPPEVVEAFVSQVAERVLERLDIDREPHLAEWMTISQATEYTGLTEIALRHLIARKKLPKHQTVERGRIMLRRSEIDAYLSGR